MILLASRSPWRKRLLKKNGIACRIRASSFPELIAHRNPRFLVLHNARGKAREAVRNLSRQKAHKIHKIIGADTVIFLGKRILGKPGNRSEASAMLRRLRGKRHGVITGVCVADVLAGTMRCAAETTWITLRKFSDAELERFLDSGQWKGKAGSYAIQGRARRFVHSVRGDLTNVVGLPMARLKKLLKCWCSARIP